MANKPKLPLKELIIKRIAIKMRISESTIEEVVNHQFKEVIKAMTSCTTIELSGFGTLIFMDKKAIKHLNVQKESLSKLLNGEKIKPDKPAEALEKDILYLQNKINHARTSKTDSRRLEEHNN